MSNPRFRNVGKDVDPKAPSYANWVTNREHQYPRPMSGEGSTWKFFGQMLFNPYFDPETRLGFWDSMHVALTTVLGSFIFGWLVYLVLWAGHTSAPATPNFIIYVVTSIVAGAVLFVTFHWTFEKDLPTYILPEIAMVMVATRKIGVVVALVVMGFQFLGYSLAGIFLHIIAGSYYTNVLILNNPLSSVGYGLYFFAGFVYTFNYIYSREFDILSKPAESDKHMHMRAAISTSVVFGVLMLTCFVSPLNLTAISAGPYFTTAVFYGGSEAGGFNVGPAGNWVVPWAFYIFIGMLAVPAAAALVYHLVNGLKSWTRGWTNENGVFGAGTVASQINMAEAEPLKGPVSIPYASSSNLKERLANVQLNVEY